MGFWTFFYIIYTWNLLAYLQRFSRSGKMPMQSALMWIVLFAWMRVLMNLRSFVELERLLQNGLPRQWADLFLLRMLWLPDFLCLTLLCLKSRISLRRDPLGVCAPSYASLWMSQVFFCYVFYLLSLTLTRILVEENRSYTSLEVIWCNHTWLFNGPFVCSALQGYIWFWFTMFISLFLLKQLC